jgi:gas vesicle protein
MNTEKVLLGALAGFATGALLGIFFAPQKGSEFRKKISDSSRDYASDVKEKFNKFVDSLSERVASVKDEAENLAEQGKSTLDHARKDIKHTAQKSGVGTGNMGTY